METEHTLEAPKGLWYKVQGKQIDATGDCYVTLAVPNVAGPCYTLKVSRTQWELIEPGNRVRVSIQPEE